MTPMCSEHAALLRGIAKNTNDKLAQKVYADWLQERGNPGWLIVLSFPIQEWAVRQRPSWGYKIPWLEGEVYAEGMLSALGYTKRTNAFYRIKYILNAYADGRVESPQSAGE